MLGPLMNVSDVVNVALRIVFVHNITDSSFVLIIQTLQLIFYFMFDYSDFVKICTHICLLLEQNDTFYTRLSMKY